MRKEDAAVVTAEDKIALLKELRPDLAVAMKSNSAMRATIEKVSQMEERPQEMGLFRKIYEAGKIAVKGTVKNVALVSGLTFGANYLGTQSETVGNLIGINPNDTDKVLERTKTAASLSTLIGGSLSFVNAIPAATSQRELEMYFYDMMNDPGVAELYRQHCKKSCPPTTEEAMLPNHGLGHMAGTALRTGAHQVVST